MFWHGHTYRQLWHHWTIWFNKFIVSHFFVFVYSFKFLTILSQSMKTVLLTWWMWCSLCGLVLLLLLPSLLTTFSLSLLEVKIFLGFFVLCLFLQLVLSLLCSLERKLLTLYYYYYYYYYLYYYDLSIGL